MAEQAASEITYVITYTNAPYPYDRKETLVVNTEEGMEDGKKVRSVKTPSDGVEGQRERYASGLYLCDDEAAWHARQTATATKEVSKKMDKKPTAPKCKTPGCTYKDKHMKLVDGRCSICHKWFRDHGTERVTGLKNDVEKKADDAPIVPMVETPNVPDTAENVASVDVPVVDAPMESAEDALDAMMADAMGKTAVAVASCSDREKAARAAMAEAKKVLAAVKEEKKREKEARVARQAEEAERKKNVVNPVDALKAALFMSGGNDALAALEAAMASGVLVAKGVKKARAPKLNDDGTPRAATPRTSGRILTNEEILDIQARLANGENVVAIGNIHGLHHVTITSIKRGSITVKPA